jgi:hypothetical protein
MTIDELIAKLQNLKEEHNTGSLEVVVANPVNMSYRKIEQLSEDRVGRSHLVISIVCEPSE